MAENDRWGFIINPVAGNGFAGEYAATVQEKIKQRSLAAQIIFTEGKGHATEIAQNFLKQNINHIIAVGGDGTFNETIQPLVGRTNVIFGAISAGTGNDFIHILGFSDHFTDEDWEAFWRKNIIAMDVGKCNDRYFLNGMGLGFDAQVAVENYQPEDGQSAKKGSKNKYLWHILKTLVTYREQKMTIRHNGEEKISHTFLNTIANGRRLAGGFYLTPTAVANDNFLDVCRMEKLSLPKRLQKLIRVMKQTHLDDPEVDYFLTKEISFEFENEAPAHLDGELYFNSKFNVSIRPQTLRVIYNANGAHYFM
ncbi:MAG: diacylglycerol kinase family lipid kinase [Calditrichaeota bacterium]|nr:diacylglycerol kinase family lipid kinase [Calditrichota bacterium]